MSRDEVLEIIRQVLYGLDNPQLDATDIDHAILRVQATIIAMKDK